MTDINDFSQFTNRRRATGTGQAASKTHKYLPNCMSLNDSDDLMPSGSRKSCYYIDDDIIKDINRILSAREAAAATSQPAKSYFLT